MSDKSEEPAYMTVKQIADAFGVSKNAVVHAVNGLGLRPDVQVPTKFGKVAYGYYELAVAQIGAKLQGARNLAHSTRTDVDRAGITMANQAMNETSPQQYRASFTANQAMNETSPQQYRASFTANQAMNETSPQQYRASFTANQANSPLTQQQSQQGCASSPKQLGNDNPLTQQGLSSSTNQLPTSAELNIDEVRLLANIDYEQFDDTVLGLLYTIGVRAANTYMARMAKRNEELLIALDQSTKWFTVKKVQALNPRKPIDWRVVRAMNTKMGYERKKVSDANYKEGVWAYHIDVWRRCYSGMLNLDDEE